jgi:hypothetical protein
MDGGMPVDFTGKIDKVTIDRNLQKEIVAKPRHEAA